MSPSLALLHDDAAQLKPLTAALMRRGISYASIGLSETELDPADRSIPARVILNRLGARGPTMKGLHPMLSATAVLDHWQRHGASILNGAEVLAIGASAARQLSLISRLGYATLRTRIVHDARELPRAAQVFGFPLVVRPNVAATGANPILYTSIAQLRASIRTGTAPQSLDGLLLIQEDVRRHAESRLRIETLGGWFLYALETFEPPRNRPGELNVALDPSHASVRACVMTPASELVRAAERIAQAARLDVGAVTLMMDSRGGVARFCGIDPQSSFVQDPAEMLGWDPNDRLVELVMSRIKNASARRLPAVPARIRAG